ncbi:Serine/threonine protein kinase, partial [Giardia duodenalis]
VTPMMWASHLYGPKVLWEAYHQINYGNHTDVPPVTLERGLWAPSRARLLPAHGERRYRTLGSVEGLALAGHTITVSGLGSGEADLAEGPVQVRSQLPDPTHTRLAFDDVLAALLGLQEGGEMERE